MAPMPGPGVSPTAPDRRVTASDGVRLAVYERGDPAAPTVLCVHGYPDNASVWDGVAGLLAADHHVVTYDVRGAGASTAPAGRDGYALDLLADDLARVAAATAPDRRPHLLGHDWGSIQTWHAVTEPRLADRFASFTSVSGPCLDHVGLWLRERLGAGPRGRAEGLAQLRRSAYIAFFRLPVVPELAWFSGVGGPALAALERLRDPGGPPPRRSVRDHVNGLELYRRNVADHLGRPRPRGTGLPVRVLVPADEVFMTEAAQAAAAAWVPDFRSHRVPGGHWVPRTRPAAVADRVRALVAEVEAARAPDGGPD